MDGLSKEVAEMIEALGWDPTDDIAVEVGGTAVSGIHQPEDANPRWSRPFGERGYNKDAFIVIKNLTRNPVVSSIPPEDPIEMYHSQDGRYEDVQ